MRYKSLLGFLIVCLASTSAVFSQPYQTHNQLDDGWYYFDDNQRHQSFDSSKQQQQIYLTLDQSFPKGAILQMAAVANTSVFIEGQVIDFITSNQILSYPLDSLFASSSSSGGQLTIMLFNSDNVAISGTEVIIPTTNLKNEYTAPIIRRNTDYLNTLLILILLTLVMFIYIKLSHADIWRGYMKWSRILSFKDQGDAIYNIRPFEKGMLTIVLGYATLGGTAIFGLFYLSEFLTYSSQHFQSDHVLLIISKWLGLVLLLFVLGYSKYFLIKSFTRLFDFKGASRIHFYNHIKISIMIVVILLLTQVVLIFGFHSTSLHGWIPQVTIGLLVVKSLLVSLKLIKISTYRIFHLFSYLCATEIIPAIIFVKITFLT